MKFEFLKAQKLITKIFLWTSVPSVVVLLSANTPSTQKAIFETPFVAPVMAIVFAVWLISLLFVTFATFTSTKYKEAVLQDVVLKKEHDERESILSGDAAKKSIMITMAASVLILLATTGQYNQSDSVGKSSVTIGHLRLSDDIPTTSTAGDGSLIIHHQLPMSKMSLVLLLMLIQIASYHAINFANLRKLE